MENAELENIKLEFYQALLQKNYLLAEQKAVKIIKIDNNDKTALGFLDMYLRNSEEMIRDAIEEKKYNSQKECIDYDDLFI